MDKHDDGSVILTKKEFTELNKAYQKLYQILSDMPTFLGDYCDSRAEYLCIEKWQTQLEGRTFNPKDYE